MKGYLAAKNIQSQQVRSRKSTRRIDLAGTLLRALEFNLINKRSYNVPSPLALEHIDENHKMIRFV